MRVFKAITHSEVLLIKFFEFPAHNLPGVSFWQCVREFHAASETLVSADTI